MRLHAAVAVLAFLALASSGFAAEKKTEGKAPADAPAVPPAAANEWHGTLGCAKCDYGEKSGVEECLPAVKTGEGLFLLKPGPTAPPAVKDFLARIQQGEMKGEYLVKGELAEADSKKWIAVSTMVAKPLPKETSSDVLTLGANRKKSTAAGGNNAGDTAVEGGGRGGGGGGGGRGRHKHADAGGDAGGEAPQ